MGLKAQAVADAKAILEDSASGFGVPLALTSPAGDVLDVVGFATDDSWLVAFADSAGVVGTWKVVEVLPDRALGVVVLRVEAYRAGAD
jgi:hypothetical protein